MENSDRSREKELQRSLGEQMLLFGAQKIYSLMKVASRLVPDNSAGQKVSTFTKFLSSISRKRQQKTWIPAAMLQWLAPKKEKEHPGKATIKPIQPDKAETGGTMPLAEIVRLSNGSAAEHFRRHETPGPGEAASLPGEKKSGLPGPDHSDPETVSSMHTKNTVPEQATSLPRATLDFFSRLFGKKMPAVTVYQGSASDKYLKYRRADAMTVGRRIYVKTGALDDARERGLGLLGHELTHVAQNQAIRQQTGFDMARNEKEALATERFILAGPSMPIMRNSLSGSFGNTTAAHQISSRAPAAPAHTPLFAESSRDVREPLTTPTQSSAGALSEIDMQRIKNEVYRDLMMRIKVDFERGA